MIGFREFSIEEFNPLNDFADEMMAFDPLPRLLCFQGKFKNQARTVARLKRGWLGVYVTTSYFSEAVQREVLEDKYPILLVNGQMLAQEVLGIVHEQGFPDITTFLEKLDRGYEGQVLQRAPEEILYE